MRLQADEKFLTCVHQNGKFSCFMASKDLVVDVPSEQIGVYPGHRRSFFVRMKTYMGDNNKYIIDNNGFNGFKNTDGECFICITLFFFFLSCRQS